MTKLLMVYRKNLSYCSGYMISIRLFTLGFQLNECSAYPILYNKKPLPYLVRVLKKQGGDILSHKIVVPSALTGLTALFGMGRGEARRYNHLKSLHLHNLSIQIISA